MGLLDEWKKITRPYDDDDDEYMDDAELVDEPEEPKPRSNPFSGFSSSSEPAASSSPAPAAVRPVRSAGAGRVVSLNVSAGQTQLVLVKPERFETAAEITDHLRSKRAVLINLETTPKEVTRRLVDFLSGAAYALDGKVKKIASNTYIITPPNVDLVGDLMDGLESSGMYF